MAAIGLVFAGEALGGDIYSSLTAPYESNEIALYPSHGVNSQFSQKKVKKANHDYLLLHQCCISNYLLMRAAFPSDELMLLKLLLYGQLKSFL